MTQTNLTFLNEKEYMIAQEQAREIKKEEKFTGPIRSIEDESRYLWDVNDQHCDRIRILIEDASKNRIRNALIEKLLQEAVDANVDNDKLWLAKVEAVLKELNAN